MTLSPLEAQDKVDICKIWKKLHISVPPTALRNEINHMIFTAEVQLMDFALESYSRIEPRDQPADVEPKYFRLRTPKDSWVDPHRTIAEQFDLTRVCDPIRFPASFGYRGQRYALKLEKLND